MEKRHMLDLARIDRAPQVPRPDRRIGGAGTDDLVRVIRTPVFVLLRVSVARRA